MLNCNSTFPNQNTSMNLDYLQYSHHKKKKKTKYKIRLDLEYCF